MKKNFRVLIQGFLFIFFFLPTAYSAPQIDGVMSYTNDADWGGSLSKTTTYDFSYSSTVLKNVVVEEGDYSGYGYDVEEIGVYIQDNILYIGLQTDYDISSNPANSDGVKAGDFIFTFGDNGDDTLSDYDLNNDGYKNGDYAYSFAFDFSISNGVVDITYLSGEMTGTGVGTSTNNYGTDWGIASSTTQVAGYEIDYSYGYSNVNSDSTDDYLDGKYTLELAINLDSLSDELSTLLNNSGDHDSVAMYWQPSCGNDFLAARADFDYTPETANGGASPVPEPGTMLLFGMGLLGAGALGRQRGRLMKSNQ